MPDNMTFEQARQRAEELRAEIMRNNHLYYDLDQPVLEDDMYDALTRELRAIEAMYPQLVTEDMSLPSTVWTSLLMLLIRRITA